MLKDGQIYGGVIPPDVNSFHISDVTLGDKVSLRLIALTDYPIGKMEEENFRRNKTSLKGTYDDNTAPGKLIL